MHDSYTRHACGIRTFTATRASRAVDAAILIAGWAVALADCHLHLLKPDSEKRP